MTVVLRQIIKGKKRRCDSRCYKATGGKCKCICGGLNHGVGLVKAINNLDKIEAKQHEMGQLELTLRKRK
jgi:hypothetical protein